VYTAPAPQRCPAGANVIYLRDGKTATISLVENAGTVTIATNGKPDAGIQMGPGGSNGRRSTMVLAAAIPLSMHPRPARVANIGFGSGLTTHTLLDERTRQTARLDRDRAIHGGSCTPGLWSAHQQRLRGSAQPHRLRGRKDLLCERARALRSHRFRTIQSVGERSRDLFSDEFYGRVTHYLTADGYFVQWMQIYETNIGILASVMKALAPHFGAYALYNTDDLDILIIATRGAALRIPDERLLQSPQLRAELARIGVQSVADIQSRKIGDNLTIGPLLQAIAVPANSDFFPFVDLNAPRLRYMRENAIGTACADRAAYSVPGAARRRRAAGANGRARREQRAISGSPGAQGSRIRRAVSSDSSRQPGSAKRSLPGAHRHEPRALRRRRAECLENCGTQHQRLYGGVSESRRA
jgi:spermidine synthase